MSNSNSMSRFFLLIVGLVSLLLSLSLPILTVTAQSRDNVELQAVVRQIPATGTFTLGVNYVATGNRALVAEVQLKANTATKFGRGSVNVNAGTGASTITVTLANNPTPSATDYEINLWSVDTNTYQNGNNPNAFNQRTSNARYNVVLGTPAAPTQAPQPTTPPQATRAPTLTPGQTPRPGNPTPPPDLIIPTLEPLDPATPTPTDPTNPNPGTDPNNPNPGTDPNNPGTNPTPDPGAVSGDRVCNVRDSNQIQCSGCGYTICRNFQAIYQQCAVGSCNALTQQCDATLPQCTEGPPTRQNSGAAPQQMICWTILMVLGAIGSWIL